MRLRVRSPFGVVNLNLSSDEPTLNDFLSEMKNARIVVDDDREEEKKKRVVESFQFGFPKSNSFVLKDWNGEATLSATFGIRDGETITVKFAEEEEEEEEEDGEAKRKRERDEEEEEEKAGDVHEEETVTKGRESGGSGDVADATVRTAPTIQNSSIETNNTNGMTEEEEALARAVEASMLDERRGDGAVAGASAGYVRGDDVEDDDEDDGTIAVRKVIDADNSCLFNAIGYVFFRSLEKAKELRKVVHDAVLSDSETFSEAALGKPPREYAEWVLKPESWGGQVELFVLSMHLQKQIAAYDVQTGRVDIYGEDRFPLAERGHLIYDGLHYDAVVFAYPGLEDVPDTHVTLVDCSQPSSKTASFDLKARNLAQKDRDRRQFTDTANFSLRCLVCGAGLIGENEAREHAKSTGHQNFGEY
jgi:ubiquitin thioesterase OTU1